MKALSEEGGSSMPKPRRPLVASRSNGHSSHILELTRFRGHRASIMKRGGPIAGEASIIPARVQATEGRAGPIWAKPGVAGA